MTATPMRFAYADPPYHRQGKKHYAKHHPDAAIWDTLDAHRALIVRLQDEYPDGWALSCGSTNLHAMLPLCPPDVRIGAWLKTFAFFKPNVNPAYAWEPVIFTGGRRRDRTEWTVFDWYAGPNTLRRGMPGAKPRPFAMWLLDLLNVRRDLGDTIDDLFPGTRGVSEAWAQLSLHENGGVA